MRSRGHGDTTASWVPHDTMVVHASSPRHAADSIEGWLLAKRPEVHRGGCQTRDAVAVRCNMNERLTISEKEPGFAKHQNLRPWFPTVPELRSEIRRNRTSVKEGRNQNPVVGTLHFL